MLKPAVVLDCGSGTIKSGLSNHPLPTNIIPSVLGRQRSNDCIYFGDLVLKKRGLISLRYPIEHGIVCNWDDMEKLLHHTFFNELRMDSKNEDVFLSEASLNPKTNREKSTEILFEKFGINCIGMASQSILSLFYSGRTNGLLIESGEGVTHSIPIYEGYSLPQSIIRSNFGGRDITDYLIKLFAEKGHKFYTIAERQIVKNIKEKICYISQNYINENNTNNKTKYLYQLPDGNNIELNYERYQAPEIIFKPKLINKEKSVFGLSELIKESVIKTEIDLRRTMWRNIVLCGGNTLFKGLKERLNNELLKVIPNSVKIKIDPVNNGKYCVWIGAAILSNISRKHWMTRKQFQEFGGSRINSIITY